MAIEFDSVTLSKELMSFDSITPNDANIFDFLSEKLTPLGFKCEVKNFSEENHLDVKNFYAKIGNEEPNLCFLGHVDVVDPGDLKLWKIDPFKPEIIDNNLYGRGASDMKASIASFIISVDDFLHKKQKYGSISILLTADEEGPAINGTVKMLKYLDQKGEKFSAAITGEPTCVEKIGDTVKIGRRGSINFEVVIMGKQGHVAYPHLADNPVSRLISILDALNSHNLDDGNEYFDPSNLEIVTIDVNNPSDNVIPQTAKARFNIRYNDLHNSKTLIKWVKAICDSICEANDAKYNLNYRISGESFITKPGKLLEKIQEAIKNICGFETIISTSGGTSDARYMKNYCPVIELGHLNKTAHKIDENVAIADIDKLTKIYSEFLRLYFNE